MKVDETLLIGIFFCLSFIWKKKSICEDKIVGLFWVFFNHKLRGSLVQLSEQDAAFWTNVLLSFPVGFY